MACGGQQAFVLEAPPTAYRSSWLSILSTLTCVAITRRLASVSERLP